MHTLLVFISVLLCFSHHVPAASSNDRGLGEPHGHHHIDLDGRKIQSKRFDDGSWDPGKYPQDNDGTQSPAQPPIEASNEKPKKEEPEGEKPEKPEEKNDDNKDDKKGCRRLEKQYIFYEPLKGAVEKFCEEANGQDRDENTGGFDLTYYGGTPDEVIIGIDWETDDKPNKDDCLEELMQLVDKCSPKGDDNPYNAKAGGKRDAGVFAYRIDPQKERHAYNGAAKAKCMCDKKRANIDCYIWGRGWGVDGKELKKHLMECDPWGPDDPWKKPFTYIVDPEWEWEAMAQFVVRKDAGCINDAMEAAQAPTDSDSKCFGSGVLDNLEQGGGDS